MQTRSSPNIHTLHKLAIRAAIPNYENMPKAKLFNKLQEQYDLDRLQRAESRSDIKVSISEERKSMSRGKKRTSSSSTVVPSKRARINKIDPIMLDYIGKQPTFRFIRPNGTVVKFVVESLVDYLLVSGDFKDPETRLPFTDDDLLRLDVAAKKAGLKKASVYEAKHNVQYFLDARFRADALEGLERCAGEVIADILDIIENMDPDDAHLRLAMREFPSFVDYYQQLNEADPTYAKKCIAHWVLFLKGPPNKPNRNYFGLIDVVVAFLHRCAAGEIF